MKNNTKAKNNTATIENFIVKSDWRRVHLTIDGADLTFLEGRNQAVQAQMGVNTWLAIACEQIKVTPETCQPFASVTDPAEITITMEKRRLDEIQQTCKEKGVDFAAAVRLSIASRCTQIRNFIKRKERKSRLALATA